MPHEHTAVAYAIADENDVVVARIIFLHQVMLRKIVLRACVYNVEFVGEVGWCEVWWWIYLAA